VKQLRPRLILADDHVLFVEGLSKMLQPRYEVVGVAYSGDALLALLPSTPADCLLLDLSLPGRSGLDLLPDVRGLQPHMRVLIVTMHLDRVLAEASLAGGAQGFIPKDSGIEELQVAIDEVLAGRRYLSPRVPKLTHRVSLGAKHLGFARLTPRQQDIVRLIGLGRSTAEIGNLLGLSPSTVTFHRANIRTALGIDSEWGLIRYAVLVQAGGSDEDGTRHRRRRS
jgi:DNA-binding NarL/FixJ family response regulator